MRRSLVLVLGWLAATIAAIGISWAGVRLVAAQVVEPLPVAIAEVTEEPSQAASPSPEASPSPVASPSPTASSPGERGDGARSEAPAGGPAAPSGDAGSSGSSSDDDDGSPGEDDPPAATETRTYSLVGGTVTVEFSSGSVRVVQATPNSGFTRKVEQEEATQVEVEFRSDEHRSRIEAWWDGGPRSDVDEDADDGGSDEGGDD